MTIDNLEIQVERKPIKNMHLSVYPPDGRVHLSVPAYLTDSDIRSYVISKWEWIKKQRSEIATQARQTQREYVSGEDHYLFGQRYRLRVSYITSGSNSISICGDIMTMQVRKDSTIERRAELMMDWYREHLKSYIGVLMDKWTQSLDESNVTWQIKQMKTMWGSCNSRKRSILYNLALARVPKECIEYVVVHELTHLKVQNHSKVYQALLTQRLPNWKNLRQQLNSFIALPI